MIDQAGDLLLAGLLVGIGFAVPQAIFRLLIELVIRSLPAKSGRERAR